MIDAAEGRAGQETLEAVYAELLHQAHVEGLYGLVVHLMQAPSAENGHTALVQAEARTGQGSFSALGEASGVEGAVASAELRAKVQALRDALDAPAALPDVEDEGEAPPRWPAWLDARGPFGYSASEEVARRIAVLAGQRPRFAVVKGGTP